MPDFQAFFDYAKERHLIYLKKQMGAPRPWTEDPILDHYKFTNVYRQLDRVTIWYNKHVRDQYLNDPARLLLATVIFRWFNRVTTGEALFVNKYGPGNETAFELFFKNGCYDISTLKDAILKHCDKGPYVTGAYIIKTPEGYTKLDGVLAIIHRFCTASRLFINGRTYSFAAMASHLNSHQERLQDVWSWFTEFEYLGDFTAYELVCDLRYSPLLRNAPDTMTWANPGPGAMRGLNRIHGRELKTKANRERFIQEMREILLMSNNGLWPKNLGPSWEMREVEHTLCEFDKYQRVLHEEGRPRGIYKSA